MAIVFIVVLFFIKTRENFQSSEEDQALLALGNEKVADLLSLDTDRDGVPDWKENLLSLDPYLPDTNGDGVPDSEEIERMFAEGEITEEEIALAEETQTAKFSQELFSTVTALSQTGSFDQNAVDALTDSVVTELQNPEVRKVYTLSEVKTISDNSKSAVQIYDNTLRAIFGKVEISQSVLEVLDEFVGDGETENVEALKKLDPIISQTQMIIKEMVETNVPDGLATFHLDVVNGLQRMLENLSDIKMFDSDVIVVVGAVNKYEENVTLLEEAVIILVQNIYIKLNG